VSWREIARLAADGREPVAFLPGWATDCRIFGKTAVGCRGVFSPSSAPARRCRDLADYISKAGCGPVVLAGWSLGAFLAVEFAMKYPELVKRLVLAGVRRRFAHREIEDFRQRLNADRKACLQRFYRTCFLPSQVADYRVFRRGLMLNYLTDMRMCDLMAGLDYLAEHEISAESLPDRRTVFVHGGRDVIAPVTEAEALARECSGGKLLVRSDASHAVFLTKEFRSAVNNG